MRFLTILFLMLAPVFAFADAFCDELWLTRNTVFDRNGVCFQSPLGQVIFDNNDCDTAAPPLSSADKAFVAQIRDIEGQFACQVDTNRTSLDVAHVGIRLALADLPILSGTESSCLGYNGPALFLTAGRHPDTAISGEILPGMNVNFAHIAEDGMEFVILENGEMGWVGSVLIAPEVCDAFAG